MNIGVIILAAGSSSRMGKPKQLLQFMGISLLQHTIDIARDSSAYPVVLVTGAEREKILKSIDTTGILIATNEDWQTGMTSSIQCGLKVLCQHTPEINAVVVLMCDQPLITSMVINDIISKFSISGNKLIQCQYDEGKGPPVLFEKTFFNQIFSLKEQNGARSILNSYADQVGFVHFPKGNIDIDTAEDYAKLTEGSEQ